MPRVMGEIPSLQDLCALTIALNIDDFCNLYYYNNWNAVKEDSRPTFGCFGDLHKQLVNLIFDQLKNIGTSDIRHLKILVSENDNVFHFVCRNIRFEDVVNFLIKRCKKLKRLAISSEFRDITLDMPLNLPLAFNAFLDLEDLFIHRSNVKDVDVVRIATHCRKLRSLDVSNTLVTDDGLYSLVRGDIYHFLKPHAIMPSVVRDTLQILDVTDLPTSQECIIELMNLPKMDVLLCDCLLDACLGIWDMIGNLKAVIDVPVYKFNVMTKVFDDEEQNEIISESSMRAALRMCPYLRTIMFDNIPDSLFSLLPLICELNLLNLQLSCFPELRENSFDDIRSILTCLGVNLEILRLDAFAGVDVAFIGLKCPNLSILKLFNNTYAYSSIDRKSFKELTFLHLVSFRSGLVPGINETSDIDEKNMKVLLSRPALKELKLGNLILTDSFFTEILQQTNFPSLCDLELTHCNEITIESIWKLVKMPNPIEIIRIFHCGRIECKDILAIKCFAKINNLNLNLVWNYIFVT